MWLGGWLLELSVLWVTSLRNPTRVVVSYTSSLASEIFVSNISRVVERRSEASGENPLKWSIPALLTVEMSELSETETLEVIDALDQAKAKLDAVRLKAVEHYSGLVDDDKTATKALASEEKATKAASRKAVALAHVLRHRLPLTLVALAEGRIDVDRVSQIDRATAVLSDDDARAVDVAIHPQACEKTPRQLYLLLRKTIQNIDPTGSAARAATRKQARSAAKEDDDSGTAWLHLFGPAKEINGSYDRVDAAARALRSEGDSRPLTELRAEVARELLLEGTFAGHGSPAAEQHGSATAGTRRRGPVSSLVRMLMGSTWRKCETSPGHIFVSTSGFGEPPAGMNPTISAA